MITKRQANKASLRRYYPSWALLKQAGNIEPVHTKNGPEGPLEQFYFRAGSLMAAIANNAMETMMPNWPKNTSPLPTT